MLIESMRDFGYSLEAALADVVDNSITARATTVQLFADTSGSDMKVGIVDNGNGMTEPQLLTAMRLGSRNPLEDRNSSELGRFGLGLKTASFSQCRRLTVVTRQDGPTSAARWDLDHVAKTDEWLVQIPDNPELIPWIARLGEHGTLVVWEDLDRVVGQDFVQRVDDARRHLELVFHRFLSGEPGLRKIRMTLNELPLEPFDPFHSSHSATTPEPVEKIKVGNHQVTVQAFTLPHHQKVSVEEWERNAGPAGYLRNQGFYVYREKRLIIHGTWFGLARQMELTKLARVRIDIPNSLDADWKIDVKKASAQPPYPVRERLRRLIETIAATSKRPYTSRGRKLISDNRLPVWVRIQDKNEIVYRINRDHPVLTEFVSRLSDELAADFLKVVELAGATLPMDALFADLGGEPEKVTASAITDESLRYAVTKAYDQLLSGGTKHTEILAMLMVAEPFRSTWERVEEILVQLGVEETSSV